VALLRIVTAVVVAGFVSAAPAAAAPDATRLSISVSDGVSQVRDKTSVAYVATVVNDGAAAVTGKLVLEVPDFARYGGAHDAKVTKQAASWTLRVPPHSTMARRATVKIGTIPSGQLRVTSLASLFLGPVTGVPAIRAADSDRIAGVVDPPATPLPQPAGQKPSAAATGPEGGGSSTWVVVGLPVLGAVGLAGLVGLVWWRRRAVPVHDDA
jgi:hypothetical protein